MIQTIRYRTAESKWDSHSSQANTGSDSPIACKISQVNFKTHEKQEEDQTKVGDKREVRDGSCREYCSRETRNPPKHRRAKQDANNDFCYDSWLPEL